MRRTSLRTAISHLQAYWKKFEEGVDGKPALKQQLEDTVTSTRTALDQAEEAAKRLRTLETDLIGGEGKEGVVKKLEGLVAQVQQSVEKVATAETDIISFHRELHGDQEKKTTGLKQEIAQLQVALAEQAKTQKEAFETRYKQIEDLLPGATAVGMAAAYREQKNANREPLWIWSGVFVVTMASMIWYTIAHFEPAETIGGAFMRLLSHLPILAFSVWLGVFAGKKVSQYFRLQQEYGHKESMAKSYVGFSREVEKLPTNARTEKLREEQLQNIVKMSAENPSETLDNGSHEEKPPMFERVISILFGRTGTTIENKGTAV
ncbi:MAG: hypothetical protein IPF78_17595 [Flavobacteriales bacterium]|nr:hypothetical protein [Flavobacteriales bacterium]